MPIPHVKIVGSASECANARIMIQLGIGYPEPLVEKAAHPFDSDAYFRLRNNYFRMKQINPPRIYITNSFWDEVRICPGHLRLS